MYLGFTQTLENLGDTVFPDPTPSGGGEPCHKTDLENTGLPGIPVKLAVLLKVHMAFPAPASVY